MSEVIQLVQKYLTQLKAGDVTQFRAALAGRGITALNGDGHTVDRILGIVQPDVRVAIDDIILGEEMPARTRDPHYGNGRYGR